MPQQQPIKLYYWPTPNGWKISIMLEEVGLPYETIPVDIGKGDQFEPDFLKISPNNKMPAIVDPEGPDGAPMAMFESGAILIYLADKTGRFLPEAPRPRYTVLQWLMFQMGHIGPMLGQAHHFRLYAPEPIPYAVDRYTNEAKRLYCVLDKRLGESAYVAGDDYTVADMAIFPWTIGHERQGVGFDDLPNVARWFEAVNARPAVRRGLALLEDRRRTGPITDEQREAMFGAKQYARR